VAGHRLPDSENVFDRESIFSIFLDFNLPRTELKSVFDSALRQFAAIFSLAMTRQVVYIGMYVCAGCKFLKFKKKYYLLT
jgi:hypothetical protein